jgi:hypothetical protein
MKRLLLTTLFVVALFNTAMAGDIQRGQTLTSGRGLVMKITSVDQYGGFRGTLTNNADGFACKGTYPVSGSNPTNMIVFKVNFAKCRSVATWRGNAIGVGMSVQWVLNYFDASGKPQIMVGFDAFFPS